MLPSAKVDFQGLRELRRRLQGVRLKSTGGFRVESYSISGNFRVLGFFEGAQYRRHGDI